MAPVLDDAMAKLGDRDRDAIVLRYFENKTLPEVGAGLGVTEDAARMRVNRALQKLRRFFSKRGVALSLTAIAGALSANAMQSAPSGVASKVVSSPAKGAATANSV